MSAFDALWATILDVGQDKNTGGYRRFAWSDADLTLREWFRGCASDRGMDVEEDRNGNLWAWWMPPGWSGEPANAFVTGSHLDSVPDGGAFDGPLGVVISSGPAGWFPPSPSRWPRSPTKRARDSGWPASDRSSLPAR